MNNHYVYLLMEREFIKCNESIYKIGQTIENSPWKTLEKYPKNSHLVLFCHVDHNPLLVKQAIENELIETPKILHRKDLGLEYFEGEIDLIKKIFIVHCFKHELLQRAYEMSYFKINDFKTTITNIDQVRSFDPIQDVNSPNTQHNINVVDNVNNDYNMFLIGSKNPSVDIRENRIIDKETHLNRKYKIRKTSYNPLDNILFK